MSNHTKNEKKEEENSPTVKNKDHNRLQDFYDSHSVSFTGTPNLQKLQRSKSLQENKKRLKRIVRSKVLIDRGVQESTEPYPPINLIQKETPYIFAKNKLVTTKYTIYNFIPKNVLEQFRRVTNIYFLLIAVVSFIPQISPISPYTTVMGLVFVLAIAALNDGYQDFKRFRADKKVNEEQFEIINRIDCKPMKIQAKDIQVGDLVYIKCDESIPADILVLSTSLQNGMCFIETVQLDGETSLKDKKAVSVFCDYRDGQELIQGLNCYKQAQVLCKSPDSQFDSFEGNIVLQSKDIDETVKMPIDSKQLLLRGSILRNTKWIIGVAVYCGQDTKLALNQTHPASKFSTLDRKINYIVICLFILKIVLCIVLSVLSFLWERDYVAKANFLVFNTLDDYSPELEAVKNFFGYFVLLSWLIPMSLMISLELVKFAQGVFMEWDEKMAIDPKNVSQTGMKVRSCGLNDELSLVRYIFTDKTGTLTENEMIFRVCSVGGVVYEDAVNGQLRQELINKAVKLQKSNSHQDFNLLYEEKLEEMKNNPLRKDIECIREFLLSLALCNTVIVDTEQTGSDNVYRAQSPDEGALVKAAKQNGFKLAANTSSGVLLSFDNKKELSYDTKAGELERQLSNEGLIAYEKLVTLEFSSERRRMSVIVRTPDGRIVLYCKGADTEIMSRLSKTDDSTIKERSCQHLHAFASLGLRTLVVAKRELSNAEYEHFYQRYYDASTSLENRAEKIERVSDSMERGLQLLGCTGIEDRLQEGVPETIEYFRRAGLYMWMITGDRMETALNIGRSSNLLKPTTEVLTITVTAPELIHDLLSRLLDKINRIKMEQTFSIHEKSLVKEFFKKKDYSEPKLDACVVITGESLKVVLLNHKDLFVEIVKQCSTVICCRVTPFLKATIVHLMKKNTKEICLAIGDGANDVSMIQEAHIGVGLFGKEGSQAALSSDFAIRRFKHLQRLLSVHGRYSLVRNAAMVEYSLYKNAAFALVQFWFAFFCGYSGQRLFDDWTMTLYNLIFTSIPPLFIAIFEKDVSESMIERNPEIFKEARIGNIFSFSRILVWFVSSVYHSLALFFVVFLAYRHDLVVSYGKTPDLWIFGNTVQTCAVIVSLLKIAFETKHWVWPVFVGIWGSLLLYFAFLGLESGVFGISPNQFWILPILVQIPYNYFVVLITVTVCLLFDYTFKFFQREFFPLDWQVLQEHYRFNRYRISEDEETVLKKLSMSGRGNSLLALMSRFKSRKGSDNLVLENL